jgi:hypothetical protein
MRDPLTVRRTVEKVLKKHDDIADDRTRGDGRLGDQELTALLQASYPTVNAQLN